MSPRAVACLTNVMLLVACAAPPARGEGPWRAQIVDADTKEPLEGVVVLAMWFRYERTVGGPSGQHHYSEEVLTDRDGRFTIAARSFFSLDPLVFFREPEFVILKPGYGRAAWMGYDTLPAERRKELGTYGRLLQLDGIVLQMPRLKTLAERREYLRRVGVPGDVPREKTPLLNEAVAKERKAVGYAK